MKMRVPFTDEEQYRWHTAALAGNAPPVHLNEPQPGWYRTRLVRGGPYVPAEIFYEQHIDDAGELLGTPQLKCEIDGRPRDPFQVWSWLASRPISREEFMSMLSGRMADVEDKSSTPLQATVWTAVKPPF